MDEQTAGVGPVDGSVRPAVYAKAEDLAQVKGCNGVSVWCENPAIFDADCRPPLSLVPLFDLDELWRVAARAAEIESSKVQAAVAAERERWELALKQTWQMVDPLKPAGQPGSYWRGQDAGITAALTTLRENLKTQRASIKRSEWVALSPEAQAKLLAITGDPGPEYRKQQALGRERALKVPIGGASCPHTGHCHPGHCPCMETKA